MASAGVPAGKRSEGKGAGVGGGKVNKFSAEATNELGVPAGQTPGFGEGSSEISMNQLPSTARVVKSAKSNLMTGSSQNRGSGGNR